MAVSAAKEALINANKTPQNIDAVMVACSNTQPINWQWSFY